MSGGIPPLPWSSYLYYHQHHGVRGVTRLFFIRQAVSSFQWENEVTGFLIFNVLTLESPASTTGKRYHLQDFPHLRLSACRE